MADLKRNVAVVIGINQYQGNIHPLQNAKADAEEMKRILSNKQDKYEVNLFIDEKATADEFWTCLEKIKSDMPDRLLIYFAGHGAPPDDKDRGHLLMRDASSAETKWVAMQDIVNYCNKLMRGMSDQITPTDREDVKRLRHLLIILDCCYAGSFRFATRNSGHESHEVSKESFKRYTETQAAQVIASSGHNEKAADFYQDRRGTGKSGHSPFAELLFNALEHDAADFTKDEVTTATEIGLYIRSELEKINLSQSCSTWSLPGYDQAEFFFLSQNFDEDKLANAIEINEENNPYRGLNSFDEAHHRFFFGRDKEIKALLEQIEKSADKGQPLTVVRGASGAGKSSLVKAGLLPKLRHERPNWRILEPVRLGSDPTATIARAMLELEAGLPNLQALDEMDSLLRKALKKLPVNDKDRDKIKNIYYQIRVSSPLDKLKAVVCEYDTIRDLLNVEGDRKSTEPKLTLASLKELYLQGQKNSEILLDEKVVEKLEKKHNENPTDDIRSLIEGLNNGKRRLKDKIDVWARKPQTIVRYIQEKFKHDKDLKVLLVIDQFEELLACSTEQQNLFLDLIQSLLEDEQLQRRVHLLLTIRSDLAHYFGKPDHQLSKFWPQSIFNLGPVTPEQLRAVIELPALAQGVFLETDYENEAGDLIKVITKEVGFDTAGVLPLLSFTLSETFINFSRSYNKNFPDRTLKVKHFNDTGGVTQSITAKADALFEGLSSKASGDKHNGLLKKKMLKNILLRMVDRDGVTYFKRKVFASELTFPPGDGEKLKENILSQLVDNRLILKDKAIPKEGAADETYYEPIHDCLITQWQKIQLWLNGDDQADGASAHRQKVEIVKNDKDEVQSGRLLSRFQLRRKGSIRPDFNLKMQRRLTEAANVWKESKDNGQGDNSRWLWHNDPALANLALVASSGTDNWLNETESKFVKASLALKTFNARRNWALAFTVMAGLSVAVVVADIQRRVSNLREHHFLTLSQMVATPVESLIRALALSGKSQLPALTKFEFLGEDALLQVLNQIDNVGYREANRLVSHKGFVNSVAFSSDGRRIVSGSSDKTIRIWELDDAKAKFKVLTLQKHKESVTSVAFSPDGRRIVSGSEDGTLMLWDASSGAIIGSSTHSDEGDRTSVAFSRDGLRIVSGRGGTLQLWDGTSLKSISEPLDAGNSNIYGVAFSPDGRRIVSILDKEMKLWDTEKLVHIRSFMYQNNFVTSVAFSPDGRHIAIGTDDDNLIILNSATLKTISSPLQGHKSSVSSVAFSPDGKRIVSGSRDNSLRLWDSASGKPIGLPIQGHTNSVNSVAFSPDGRSIVSGSDDNTLRLWDVYTGPSIDTTLEGHDENVNSVAFSPDGRHIVSGSSDKTLRLWNADSGKSIRPPFQGHGTWVNSVAFSPDGQRIVSGSGGTKDRDNQVAMWDVATGIGKTIGSPHERHTGEVKSVAFSPDGKSIVSGSVDNTLRLWDVASGKLIHKPLEGHNDAIRSVAFSPDGRRLVSGSNDYTLRIWNLDDGKTKTLKGHNWRVTSVGFSPDGKRIVSGSDDKTLRLWDVRSGKPIGSPLQPTSDAVESVAFSPNGRRIVSGFANGSIRIWDAYYGQAIGPPLKGGGLNVNTVAFSPDGLRIVSGSGGCFEQRCGGSDMRMWDINPSISITFACQLLRRHQLLLHPETFDVGSEFEDLASRARAICDLHLVASTQRGLISPPSAAVPGQLRMSILSRSDKVR